MKEYILNYQIDTVSTSECCDQIVSEISKGEKTWLACFNPHSYAVSLQDSEFKSALNDANWLIPDGIGVVHASKVLSGNIKDRITGFDIFEGIHTRLNGSDFNRIFFLGSTTDTLECIKKRMSIDYPHLEVVGVYSPPFKDEYDNQELDKMITAINIAKPDILWVGLTAPKQEKWIFNNISRLDIKFAGAIGAVFDFYTGKVKRSHPIFQKLGLEWLPRLIQQPKRLWKRMFISAPIFMANVIKNKISKI